VIGRVLLDSDTRCRLWIELQERWRGEGASPLFYLGSGVCDSGIPQRLKLSVQLSFFTRRFVSALQDGLKPAATSTTALSQPYRRSAGYAGGNEIIAGRNGTSRRLVPGCGVEGPQGRLHRYCVIDGRKLRAGDGYGESTWGMTLG